MPPLIVSREEEVRYSIVVWAHLEGLSTQDVLMQGGYKDFRQMVDLLLCFLTAPHQAVGNTVQ